MLKIRLESIGGLGANLAGKLLGQAAADFGCFASAFSSYGSEKKGSPVKAYIRIDQSCAIRENFPITKPDILCIFQDRVSDVYDTLSGITEDTFVIINTKKTADEAVDTFKLPPCKLCVIDALGISIKLKTRLNMVLMGAISRVCPFTPIESLILAVKNELGRKYPHSIQSNTEGIKYGCENAVFKDIKTENPEYEYKPEQRQWGYENAPIGGVNPFIGSTITNNLSAVRAGFMPVFIKERCINCGLCDSTCPDMVFVFEDGKNKGLDYDHCKGCLRCVDICPTQALVEGEETDDKINLYDKALLRVNFHEDFTGANSWVESDSWTKSDTQ